MSLYSSIIEILIRHVQPDFLFLHTFNPNCLFARVCLGRQLAVCEFARNVLGW